MQHIIDFDTVVIPYGPHIEEWKDVAGYDGIYRISNYGRVLSIGRFIYRKNGTKQWNKDKIMKPCVASRNNYRFVNLFKSKGVMNSVSLHRMVAIAFIPNPENKPEVNHKHGDKSGNVFVDLEWATSVENKKHAWETGLYSHEKSRAASFKRWEIKKSA